MSPEDRLERAIRAAHGPGEYTRQLVRWRLDWLRKARPKQLPPAGPEWDVWNIVAGRGFGKTRIGAEDAGFHAAAVPFWRGAVVGATQNDVRSVCFEGESGLLNVVPGYFIRKGGWNRSLQELELINGSLLIGKSAEKPDRLRGPQFHRAWTDETAAWQRLDDTWSNLQFGLRLGKHPRIINTTTPRPIDFLKKLIASKRSVTTRGSTFENEANLAATALRALRETYEGTRKGRQELYAEILEAAEGALWGWSMLEKISNADEPKNFERTVIAVDPAVTSGEDSDEWGVIVASRGDDGLIYVRADLSGKYSPHAAARVILSAYDRFEADALVAETNQGGDLIEALIKGEADGEHVNYKGVRAKRGKYLRAEPVAAYYEKDKVRHVGRFPRLEQQMCSYEGLTDADSPDRLDALVYGVGELMIGHFKHDFW